MTPPATRTGFRRLWFCWKNTHRAAYRFGRTSQNLSRGEATVVAAAVTAIFPALYLLSRETRETAERTIHDTLHAHD